MTGWEYVLAGIGFAMIVAGAVALMVGRFCALTSEPAPQRHPSAWRPTAAASDEEVAS